MENLIVLKKCIICNLEKDSILDFRFHQSSKSFCKKCKLCENTIRRQKYIPKIRGASKVYKTCTKCSVKKLRTIENFDILSEGKRGKIFSKSCKDCRTKLILPNPKKRNPSHKDESILKCCNICLKNKPLSEYYFHFKLNTHSFCCITCEAKRQKDAKAQSLKEKDLSLIKIKQDNLKNKARQLLRTYTIFDFDRDLICDVDIDYITECLKQPCTYCTYPSTGLDRKNNSLGHLKENCVPACKDCNTARMNNFSYEEMFFLGKVIKEIKDKRICQH